MGKENSQELKNGITEAMINEKIQITMIIPVQDAQPTTVWLLRCLELRNSRKKTKRTVTEAYRHPRKMIVGIMNEKAIFLYLS